MQVPDQQALSQSSELRLALVAGESSGDQIAAAVIDRLLAQRSDLQVRGIGGPALRNAGMHCDADIEALSLRGYVEVIRHLPRLLRLRRKLFHGFLQWRPQLFLGVDAPDFNLNLASALKQNGIYCYHLVGPSIWAWRPERKWKIAKAVDHLLLLFPFEEELYIDTGLKTTYVGHPMADQIDFNPDRIMARRQLGLDRIAAFEASELDEQASRWFCLLPGSRLDEIRQHAEVMLKAAQHLALAYPKALFLMPAANPRIYSILKSMLKSTIGAGSHRVVLFQGQAQACIAASDQVLAASGTVCLQAALTGRPMVIIYRMPELSYRWMKRLQLQAWIGLPNILARGFLVPELIQTNVTVKAIVDALETQWADHEGRATLQSAFYQIHRSLRCDCAGRAAGVIQAQLEKAA